jgi:hypothetical protein
MENDLKKMGISDERSEAAPRTMQETLERTGGEDYLSDVDQNQSAELLPLPSLNSRVVLYLRAIHGSREFTDQEYRQAREVILDEMTACWGLNSGADLKDGSSSPSERTPPHYPAIFASAPMALEDAASYGRYSSMERALPALAKRACIEPIEPPDENSIFLSALRDSSDPDTKGASSRSAPRLSRRWVAIAAVVGVCSVLVSIYAPQTWFSSEPKNLKPSMMAQNSPVLAPISQAISPMGLVPNRMDQFQNAPMPRENAFAIVDRLLRLANELVVSGNAPAARLILKEAADAGYASAALAMGSTFDPFEIGKLNEHEVTPDVPLARMWYERADRLGSPEALDRLKRLQSAN